MKLTYSTSSMVFEIILDIKTKEVTLDIPHTRHNAHHARSGYDGSYGLRMINHHETVLVREFVNARPWVTCTVGVAYEGTMGSDRTSRRRFDDEVSTAEMFKRVTMLYLSLVEYDRRGPAYTGGHNDT